MVTSLDHISSFCLHGLSLEDAIARLSKSCRLGPRKSNCDDQDIGNF